MKPPELACYLFRNACVLSIVKNCSLRLVVGKMTAFGAQSWDAVSEEELPVAAVLLSTFTCSSQRCKPMFSLVL